MKRFTCAAVAVAFAAMAAPGQASAQVTVGIGGAATIPTGDYGDFANTGWMGAVGVTVPVGESGLGVGATGVYGSNGHDEAVVPGTTDLLGALAHVGFSFATGGSMTPYVVGNLGFLQHKWKVDGVDDVTDSGLAFGGAAGLMFPLGSVVGRVQASYLIGSGDIDGTDFFGIGAGIGIPLGGGM
ncbi:MAG: outer membrane beta-barrel protein [Gemmatimonadota bacterium]|jgi:hypothetical protein